jgi:hypothetical protein
MRVSLHLLLILGLFWSSPSVLSKDNPIVVFAQDIYGFDDLAFAEGTIFALLTRDHTLFKVDRSSGEILKTYIGKGKGPGEWIRPRHVLVHDERVYVFDLGDMDMSVFSIDLEHIEDVKFNMRVEHPLINNQGLFVASFNQAKHSIIGFYPDSKGNAKTFGKAAPVHPGNQWGYLAQKGNRLYYLSGVYFRISIFNFNGNLIEEIEPPFGNKDFFDGCDLTALNFAKTCDEWATARDILADDSDHLYVYLRPRNSQQFYLYRSP